MKRPMTEIETFMLANPSVIFRSTTGYLEGYLKYVYHTDISTDDGSILDSWLPLSEIEYHKSKGRKSFNEIPNDQWRKFEVDK